MSKQTNEELTILILAAGPSSRMGQSKQQLVIDGKPLLTQVIQTALDSNTGKVTVVLGAYEHNHRKLINGNVGIIFNPHWETGMGNSLKAGLQHVLSVNPDTNAILVMVCDQPLLTANHLRSLVDKYEKTKSSIVASAYSGTVGVPALFQQKHFDEILKLKDDQGAKKIIQQHTPATIDFPEGAIDLDTQKDLKTFLEQRSKKMP